MKDNELLFDRKSHVLYSKPCKKEILAKMAVREILLCWLRELVAVRAVFKTLRGERACKALSLGEVAAAVRLRKAGFGEGTPQHDSDGTG